jgi:hypothetical protein
MEMLPAERLFQMITGFTVSQAIYVAARLGIADLLKEGPKDVDDPAKSAEAARGLLADESGSGSEGKRYE